MSGRDSPGSPGPSQGLSPTVDGLPATLSSTPSSVASVREWRELGWRQTLPSSSQTHCTSASGLGPAAPTRTPLLIPFLPSPSEASRRDTAEDTRTHRPSPSVSLGGGCTLSACKHCQSPERLPGHLPERLWEGEVAQQYTKPVGPLLPQAGALDTGCGEVGVRGSGVSFDKPYGGPLSALSLGCGFCVPSS